MNQEFADQHFKFTTDIFFSTMWCKNFLFAVVAVLIQYGSGQYNSEIFTTQPTRPQRNIIPPAKLTLEMPADTNSTHHIPQRSCPPWFISTSGDCECERYSRGNVRCDKDTNKSYIRACYCMTFINGKSAVGHFYHSCFLPTQYDNLVALPNTTQALEELMCGSMHRRGQLCGSCQQNHTPPVYSYYLGCVYCPEGTSNWIKYIFVAFLPLTAFCIVMLVFRINGNSGYLVAFILFSQGLTSPPQLRAVVAAQYDNRFHTFTSAGMKTVFSLYGIWSLDFFRLVYSPFCLHAGIDTLSTLTLDYVIAIYPLFLVLVTYVLVQMHARGFRLIVWLWKPFHFGISRIRRQWDATTSLIDAFATFLLLSHVKLISVSFDLLVSSPLYAANGTRLPNLVLFYDPSVEYFGPKHLPYGVLAVGVFVVFVLIPLLLLFVYPCRCFQKLLIACRFRCFALHTFMDAFQAPFKNGIKQTRDYRYFSGVFLLVRIVLATVFALNIDNGLYIFVSLVWISFAISIAALKPFKLKRCNSITTVLLLTYAVGCISLQYKNQPSFENDNIYAHLTTTLVVICIISPLVYITALIVILLFKRDALRHAIFWVQWPIGKFLWRKTSKPLNDSLPHRVTHEHQYMQRPLLSTVESSDST